jgi:hypothetical protein
VFGCVTLWFGYGSVDPYHRITEPDMDPTLLFSGFKGGKDEVFSKRYLPRDSVVDLASRIRIFSIPDPGFFSSQIRIEELKYFKPPKMVSKHSEI